MTDHLLMEECPMELIISLGEFLKTHKEWLDVCADISAILTLIVGFGLWCLYRWRIYLKRLALENYLKKRLDKYRQIGDEYQFGFLHLTVKTGLSESEILEASFGNKHIKRTERIKPSNNDTDKVLFQYDDGNPIEYKVADT